MELRQGCRDIIIILHTCNWTTSARLNILTAHHCWAPAAAYIDWGGGGGGGGGGGRIQG